MFNMSNKTPKFTKEDYLKLQDELELVKSKNESLELECQELNSRLKTYNSWLKNALVITKEVASGNLEPRFRIEQESKDLLEISININRILDLMDAFLREAKAVLKSAARGDYWRKVILNGMLGTFGQVSKVINEASDELKNEKELLDIAKIERLKLTGEFHRVIDIVHNLGDNSKKVVDAIQLISNVAFKTQILSLNANIEAAKAGEAGKTFSVVGYEVGALAKRTTEASEIIKKEVEGYTYLVQDAVNSIEDIARQIRDLD